MTRKWHAALVSSMLVINSTHNGLTHYSVIVAEDTISKAEERGEGSSSMSGIDTLERASISEGCYHHPTS